MSTAALTTMVLAQGFFTFFAVYFLYRVMTTPPKKEPDSYSENDDDEVARQSQ